jgi:DNA-binding FadR family transcriptional regulator
VQAIMLHKPLASEFLQYLLRASTANGACQLPSLNDISQELGISVARLREQVEVAKALGLVEVRPRTGMRRLPYSFSPAVWQSLSYGLVQNPALFQSFADLRNHVEAAYWDQAVCRLSGEDHSELQTLVARAWEKLRGSPVQIPHAEHRQLHLTIFRKLENPFVNGILEAYWQAYEDVGLNLYADYGYLEQVWAYHQKMVDCICSGDYAAGYRALIDHKDLLHYRPERSSGAVSKP